jgi:hypothetical protein
MDEIVLSNAEDPDATYTNYDAGLALFKRQLLEYLA